MYLIFVGQGYPQKLFNLEHFLIYGILRMYVYTFICTYNIRTRITVIYLVHFPSIKCVHHTVYVTGFMKTSPNHTRTKIHFIA